MDSDKFQELVLQQLKTLTEGQARVEGRLGQLGGRMGDLEGSLGQLGGRMGDLEGSLGQLGGRMGDLEGSLGQLELRLDKLEGRMGDLEGSLDKLGGRMGDLEGSLGQLELRLDKLELRMENEAFNKIAALFDGFDSLSETLADHTACLQRIEEKVTDHDIRIEVLDKTKASKRKTR